MAAEVQYSGPGWSIPAELWPAAVTQSRPRWRRSTTQGDEMSEARHTPGPVSVDPHRWGTLYDADGNLLAETAGDRCRENAERLAACWNACGSLADPSAVPDLLAAQTMGAQLNTPDFLDWLADRLVHVYGESPNADFVHSLKQRASAARAAIRKATGTTN